MLRRLEWSGFEWGLAWDGMGEGNSQGEGKSRIKRGEGRRQPQRCASTPSPLQGGLTRVGHVMANGVGGRERGGEGSRSTPLPCLMSMGNGTRNNNPHFLGTRFEKDRANNLASSFLIRLPALSVSQSVRMVE